MRAAQDSCAGSMFAAVARICQLLSERVIVLADVQPGGERADNCLNLTLPLPNGPILCAVLALTRAALVAVAAGCREVTVVTKTAWRSCVRTTVSRQDLNESLVTMPRLASRLARACSSPTAQPSFRGRRAGADGADQGSRPPRSRTTSSSRPPPRGSDIQSRGRSPAARDRGRRCYVRSDLVPPRHGNRRACAARRCSDGDRILTCRQLTILGRAAGF